MVDGALALPPVRFLAPHGFVTHRLAYMLDSLVRVSRRVDWSHSANVLSAQVPEPETRACSPQPTRRQVMCTAGPAHVDQGPALGAVRRTAQPKPGPTRCLQSLSPQQFQALFDSLFKVLFIFPSRYLFAIGLSPVFSLRWNLPPTLGCNPKQPDSSNATREAGGSTRTGLSPSAAPRSRGLVRGRPLRTRL